MGAAVTEVLVAWIGGLDDAPAEATEGALEVAQRLASAPSERGSDDFAALLDEALEAARHTFEYSGPGYLAYIPGGGLFTAALAEFLAQGLNRYVGLWQPSPGHGPARGERHAVALRPVRLPARDVAGRPHVRWVDGELLGGRDGAAREARRGLPRRHLLRERAGARVQHEGGEDRGLLRAERSGWSPPTPSCGWTRTRSRGMVGGRIARPASVRSWWSVRPGRRTPARSIRSTTIADVAAREGMWMHVDAAYGGFFQLTDRGRAAVRGHRAGRLDHARPAQGAVPAVRDRFADRARRRGAARRPLTRAPRTCRTCRRAGSCRTSPSTRPSSRATSAGLRVWLPLKLHGVAAFREALDEKLDLTDHAVRRRSRPIPQIEIPWDPQLTVVPFRLRGADEAANRGSSERINASKRVFLSSTLMRGEYVLRVCICQPPDASRTGSTSASTIVRDAAAAGGGVSPCRRCRRSWRWPSALRSGAAGRHAPRRSTCCSSPR